MNLLTSEIPTARYFRYFFVGIRYFSVSVIPTSVSISVFENTAVSVRYRYYRLRTNIFTVSQKRDTNIIDCNFKKD